MSCVVCVDGRRAVHRSCATSSTSHNHVGECVCQELYKFCVFVRNFTSHLCVCDSFPCVYFEPPLCRSCAAAKCNLLPVQADVNHHKLTQKHTTHPAARGAPQRSAISCRYKPTSPTPPHSTTHNTQPREVRNFRSHHWDIFGLHEATEANPGECRLV